MRSIFFALALFAAVLAVLTLNAQCFKKGEQDANQRLSDRLSDVHQRGGGVYHGPVIGDASDGDASEPALKVSPALAWRKLPAVEVSGRYSQTRTLENDSEWVDPLLTHRIFSGRDGRVYISRDIAPDPEFWAGVGVAGCESEWRAAVDSPTGDTGFWQLNRRWQEWRFLRRGWTWDDAKDPEKNTEIAFDIWSEQGWGPWSTKSCVGRSMGTSGDY